ncbi:HNH endonuclease signature motif containing protein [Arsenicicoccus sp. oral taxon 190]|uniref:HNH endonuclease signature motif containing protein n=1 Tax=Arsenicicoccus sp. oral taxon 190 TaxID=1658671 RepID=UPI0012E25332|nr:HNH endonuclease signature motif containing protein [Arsenicicoccus sp. oral taxon 190]
MMGDHTAFGPAATPAWLPGYGPVPAPVARRLLRGADQRTHGSTGDEPGLVPGDGVDGDDPAVLARAADVFLSRLYTHPASGELVSLDSRSRAFDGALRRLIVWRDGTCRAPGCDSPIRHVDHARTWRDGGATSAGNGVGVCAAHNYAHEAPGHTLTAVEAPPDDTGWARPPGIVYRFPDGSEHTTAPPPLLPSVWGPVGSRPRQTDPQVD